MVNMTLTDALQIARDWAMSHPSPCANCAVVYIDAIELNRIEGASMGYTQKQADKIQFAYILSNLTGWRGDDARQAKAAIKAAVK